MSDSISPRGYESLKISSNEFEILHFLEINRCYVQKSRFRKKRHIISILRSLAGLKPVFAHC